MIADLQELYSIYNITIIKIIDAQISLVTDYIFCHLSCCKLILTLSQRNFYDFSFIDHLIYKMNVLLCQTKSSKIKAINTYSQRSFETMLIAYLAVFNFNTFV